MKCNSDLQGHFPLVRAMIHSLSGIHHLNWSFHSDSPRAISLKLPTWILRLLLLRLLYSSSTLVDFTSTAYEPVTPFNKLILTGGKRNLNHTFLWNKALCADQSSYSSDLLSSSYPLLYSYMLLVTFVRWMSDLRAHGLGFLSSRDGGVVLNSSIKKGNWQGKVSTRERIRGRKRDSAVSLHQWENH